MSGCLPQVQVKSFHSDTQSPTQLRLLRTEEIEAIVKASLFSRSKPPTQSRLLQTKKIGEQWWKALATIKASPLDRSKPPIQLRFLRKNQRKQRKTKKIKWYDVLPHISFSFWSLFFFVQITQEGDKSRYSYPH